jgi:ribosome modulation factor
MKNQRRGKISGKRKMLRERKARYTTTRRRSKDAIERAFEFGVDITLLEQNPKLTPTQRLEKFQSWLAFAEEVRRAGEKKRREDAARGEANL